MTMPAATTTEEARHNIVPCVACGYTYAYKGRHGELSGRFCSPKCQNWYDAGGSAYGAPDEVSLTDWKVVAGDNVGADYYTLILGHTSIAMKRSTSGLKIKCVGCSKEFDSRGLRYCSNTCSRNHRERQDNLAVMAEAGMEPATKRGCAGPGCEKTIPKWRNGRAVSSVTRFCSPACGRRAQRADRASVILEKETQ
jgi:hypothetical protein